MKFCWQCGETRATSTLRRCRRELLRRGHEVRMAVAPDVVGFAESAGLRRFAYGRICRPLRTRARLDAFLPHP